MTSGEQSKQKNEGESIDSNSPFYIHASDYPKQMQVNEVPTDSNYNDWAQEMTNFLLPRTRLALSMAQ